MEEIFREFREKVFDRDWEEFYGQLMFLRSGVEKLECYLEDPRLSEEDQSRLYRKVSRIYEIIYELERRLNEDS
jgi:hypothetical protein